MPFLITARIFLAASPSARNGGCGPEKGPELAEGGCLNVAITAPDGRRYPSEAFDRLLEEYLEPRPHDNERLLTRGLLR
jgi:hypothetical protein